MSFGSDETMVLARCRNMPAMVASGAYFLDSHHVGVFEGTLQHAGGVSGQVSIARRSEVSAELLVQWA